ncbi:ANTAR domain-containing protein [Streptomyces griseus]|uniref:ANTAR domain-containing protein n=1 Tax=Streptomyces griseus TaxID=1911 RepID=UPI00083FFAFC|nr:ANTAR domain-containing protein [Streptomyces griseus]
MAEHTEGRRTRTHVPPAAERAGHASAKPRDRDKTSPDGEVAALRSEVEGLRTAIASRPVIDTARGILMAMGPCTAPQAWQTLVHASQNSNTKLRDLAHQLVDSFHGTPLPPATRDALHAAMKHTLAG